MSTPLTPMRTILVAGAGKSSIYLIQYLLTHAANNRWYIVVADNNLDAIREKIGNHPNGYAEVLDITDKTKRQALVKEASLVVSLMPPHLHIHLAQDCLEFRKNLITSSYISEQMRAMDSEVKAAGLMFMCEMGLDPGIDHMTASQIIDGVRKLSGNILSFKSYCGGLIAPESDDNPWHYKFSWNPRNIITAGADGAAYLAGKKNVSVGYDKMFDNNKRIQVDGLGELAYYANRDSLRYLDIYEVPEIDTFLRATLRHPDFCKGWEAVVRLGLTAMTDDLPGTVTTYSQWLAWKTGYDAADEPGLKDFVAQKLQIPANGLVMRMLSWLGLFDALPIAGAKTNSGEVLLGLLLDRWAMKPTDKDMVVMQHEVSYTFRDREVNLISTMVLKGEDREFSAMAKTVGLPMGILARMVMRDKVELPVGVHIPNMPEVYKPVMRELSHHGIVFQEHVS